MGDIVINKTNGGLGRTLSTDDYISGIIFYNDKAPNFKNLDEWVTATEYVIGDLVYDATGKNSYIANADHTAGLTFAADIANWDEYTKTVTNFTSILDVETAGILKGSTDWSYEWYHLNEYFRVNSEGEVYVYIKPIPASTYDYAEVTEIQDQAEGVIKQCAIFAPAVTFATAELTKIQGKLDLLEAAFRPMVAIYTADFSSFTDLTTLPDLTAITAPGVSVILGQDGDAVGKTLSSTNNGAVGAVLGAISKAKVHYSVAWVDAFNMTDGTELSKPAMANGQLVEDLTDTVLDGIDDSNYLFLIKREGVTGTYNQDSWTSTARTSDYVTIENNRTWNKANRGIRTSLVGLLYSPLKVESGGTMSPSTVDQFESKAGESLFKMLEAGELSAYEVYVDPTQNVLSTSKVEIEVRLRPYGVARDIEVTLGFSANI